MSWKFILASLLAYIVLMAAIATVSYDLDGQKTPSLIVTPEFYQVTHEFKSVRQFFWNKDLFIVDKASIYSYDTESRNLTRINQKSNEENFILGKDFEGNTIKCSWENYTISSPEEDSTVIRVVSLNNPTNVIKEVKTFETLRPITCTLDVIEATYSYHGAPEEFFSVSLDSGEVHKVPAINNPFTISGDTETKITKQGNLLFLIPKVNNFVYAEISSDQKKAALLDLNGDVWIYTTP